MQKSTKVIKRAHSCKIMIIITICFLSSALLFLWIEDLIPKTSLLLIKVKFTIIIITHVHCNRISVIYLSSSFLKTFFCKHHHISYVKENLVIFKKSERLTKTMLGERRSWYYEAVVDSFHILWTEGGQVNRTKLSGISAHVAHDKPTY